MTTVRLPDCPTCRQPFTTVYQRRLGCVRCGTVGAIARPELVAAATVAT